MHSYSSRATVMSRHVRAGDFRLCFFNDRVRAACAFVASANQREPIAADKPPVYLSDDVAAEQWRQRQ